MYRFSYLLLCLIGLGGCGTTDEPVEVMPPEVAVHCLFLDLPDSFLRNLGTDGEVPPVFSDIETFFLFKYQGGIQSKPLQFRCGETIKLSHTSQHSPTDRWLNAKATMVDDKLQLWIFSSELSPVQLPTDISVELPGRGTSTMIKTANSLSDDRSTFVLVISATDTL
ncbi:MAG: hypothetical protein Q8M16_20765 [Pirellulaceae bacterium]|nr:hypothetical protein [Pirellulaceae bacterium]